ncbi:ATP F0F1 synthase subunit delta [Dietzia sp. UCD-THP]|uniref:F0F1 ATP synthase subunit delta n=1 Tax=Dietzia sp. UCD-THP TaxID=1292020 RepID=UPI000437AF5C|nr:F0F1 ATP synthase subunit delta [Dietzia sp. UCD-THP]EYT63338.1 ATP F0F1 synthase subunit delta [Dietzia sp. UCD-THP]
MHAASREALDHTRSALEQTLAANPAGGATGAKVGQELFEVVGVLEDNRALRVSVADTAAPVEARQDLVRGVFGWKVDQATLDLLLAAVSQDWSTPRELREGLVLLGREALLRSADQQGQLQTVEDELFRLGRIVAGDPQFEQLLADRTADVGARRGLLAEVLYGKVTAVTEALASQAVARPSGMPADDIMAVSVQAAELRGRSVAVVTSAEPLTGQQSDDLRARLASLYGREIAIHNDVDQSLLGGVVVRVGDEIIDGSVAGRLDAMRRSLR